VRVLDLFCGAGGAAMGYARAGFDVVGVDIEPQPRYPFPFVQADAIEYGAEHGAAFDLVHASPPCQAYSPLRHLPWLRDRVYWDSLPPTLEMLAMIGRPYVVENVERAPLDGLTLCGAMFGLAWPDGTPIYRHRRFLSTEFLLAPGHPKHFRSIAPSPTRNASNHANAAIRERIERGFGLNNGRVWGGHQSATAVAGSAVGIEWMTSKEVAQAIPPAYTEWMGAQLLPRLERVAV